jgi:alpha-L-rhamnosidase
MHTEFKLFCEYSENPLGIDNKNPGFSWAISNAPDGAAQTAYQVMVFSAKNDAAGCTNPDMWDSGKVETGESAFVVYAGKSLQSRTRYFWRVRVWDKTGSEPVLSQTGSFETAFMDESEWRAKWIGPSRLFSANPIFRRIFAVKKNLAAARVYVSGLSSYELMINGVKVNRNMLEPSWTDYYKHIMYNVLDVTGSLREGANVMTVLMGSLRFMQFMLLLEIHLLYEDGTEEVIYTDRDHQWGFYSKGPVTARALWTAMAIYHGENIDGRIQTKRLDDPSVANAEIENMYNPLYAQSPGGRLTAQRIEPIRAVREYPAVTVAEPKPGIFIVDFGQNLAGWVRIRVSGEAGQKITIRHGELLHDDGTLNVATIRQAQSREEYILGGGKEVFEPHFTYHGFRYAEVTGYPGVLKAEDITAILARNDVPFRSEFSCGNELLNRIHRLMIITEENNMHGVPTDCPQRDERLGWTNEGTIRAETSLVNFEGINFFRKWEADLADTQTPMGTISDTAPEIRGMFGKNPADAVASCYQLIPWLLYLHYGDRATMKKYYPGIKAWTNYKKLVSENGIVDYFYYADWTSPAPYSFREDEGVTAQSAITPGEMISTGFWLWENRLMAQIARALGKFGDAGEFENQAELIAGAFNKKWLSAAEGYYQPGSQAAQVLPLWLGIVPKEYTGSVIAHLVKDIQEKNYTHSVGNQCWKMLPEVLCEYGHTDTAFRMLTNTAYPSIGFMLENGATTLWERWEKLEGIGMNSHNQPSFGSVDVWFYKYLAGIKTTGPGFSTFTVKPFIPRDLDSAQARINTIGGEAASSWKKDGNTLKLAVTVPWNSTASIEIPPEMDGKKVIRIDAEDKETAKEFSFRRGCGIWHFTAHYGG